MRVLFKYYAHFPRRLGEITLLDIRDLLDKGEQRRYHFKTMDPEFGTVKEEVSTMSILL